MLNLYNMLGGNKWEPKAIPSYLRVGLGSPARTSHPTVGNNNPGNP